MKISLAWVEEFTDIKLPKEELIRRIGAQLGAIEDIEYISKYYDQRIVIARIKEASVHPDADKLGLYKIEIDQNGTTRNLVAGDKTLEQGNLVAYIPPGVNVPQSVKDGEPFEIAEREIRGHMSQGMMASAKEILFSDDHSGVMKLETDADVGDSLVDVFNLNDTIVDVENKMFTHRPDLFGILGVARELAGIQELNFTSPDWYSQAANDVFEQASGELVINVDNQVPELCPRFTAVALDNVQIKPSPTKMQSMLSRVGLRPINNVVDITNYIMYMTAQPLHAFDYDKVVKIAGGSADLVVRKPLDGEKLTILDGRELTLGNDVVLVATKDTALSVAGSIGGANSEVDDKTTKLILEVANWDLYSIRRTSFEHGIFTDAVTRYNKGQSTQQCRIASAQAVELLQELAGAKISSTFVDDYPAHNQEHEPIKLKADFVNVRLGSSLSSKDIAEILSRTEIISNEIDDHNLEVSVPFWRTDLEVAEDLVEEVGRLIGFDNLPVELPLRRSAPVDVEDMLVRKAELRNLLAAAGSNEVITYNFVSAKLFDKSGFSQSLAESAYKIRNSISPELQYMRLSLLPSLLDVVNPNVRQNYSDFSLFEINKVHNNQDIDEENLPKEKMMLAWVYAAAKSDGAAYYQAKARVDYVLDSLGLSPTYERLGEENGVWQLATSSMLAPQRSAKVMVGEKCVGYVGEFNSAVKRQFKLPEFTSGFELDISLLEKSEKPYKAISKFPASTQDITLEVPDEMTFAELNALVGNNLTLKNANIKTLLSDIFRQDENARRRFTFNVEFRSSTRTLTTDEVNEAIKNLADKLKQSDISHI